MELVGAVPDVLYPPINVSAFDEAMKQAKADVLSEDKWKPLRYASVDCYSALSCVL